MLFSAIDFVLLCQIKKNKKNNWGHGNTDSTIRLVNFMWCAAESEEASWVDVVGQPNTGGSYALV